MVDSPSGGMTVAECQDFIQKSFQNPTVKFLKENLEKSGCRIGTNFIKAVHCQGRLTSRFARGFAIQVCSNNLRCEDEVVQVVIHELVRAYDECRAANLDWTNCTHHACNEIRANHLSGYCHLKRELLRGNLNIKGHEQECVWRRAMKAVIGNPYCSEIEAEDAMKFVWSSCYNDTAPFDRAP
ncbi:mitochondrial inner membrane protease ATP23-like isoform X2 [Salvia splendens]|uniref:mitochondrial inner membrane protease ATP23-like isoform X2 n=1 Tax=Salvia splendens TaxID=180675 RepID=UPI001C2572DD|nr:mitochondrial inner membrane protease ATP23-like isoform X2 [Salvia splendens]